MSKELAKTYEPQEIEDKIYQRWLDMKYFHAEVDKDRKPFTIVMPPPNVTGQLHMGHALDNTLQDILIRWKRMQGYSTLWQPGTDHAAIATEVKVTNMLKDRGIDKHEIGREAFLKYAWEWKEEYGSRIVSQLHRLGSSADWDRERFTMDEGCSEAVEEVFCRLYDKGYIYKGSRIINWCPVCRTSLSDAEVEHEDQNGFFWHINYPIVGEEGRFVEIATTRPETMLGDTAVAVNPEDERYRDIVGKMLELPLTGRTIPVIADSYVDKEFGTGCVKITPAHDPNDFEVGKRHDLEEINILNDDATINEAGGKYAGMDRYEARKQIVKDLEKMGLLVRVVPHAHAVGTHDRCHTTVEPMIKPQWFVRMKEMAEAALEVVKTDELNFVPDRFEKTYNHWLETIRDWCISRQLWWGHRIPAYTCDACGEMIVRKGGAPEVCPKCGCTHFTQDEDSLDTWFSSALWPFSTLGWPHQTPELEYFFPTNVLVTGYDIIFFWVIRMVFSSLEQTGKSPFKDVLIHGLVRDALGRKMSKSLGNGIDPLEVISQYGADALRLTLVTGNAPGNDMRFSDERMQNSRNFANKVWNASRFIMMNLEKAGAGAFDGSGTKASQGGSARDDFDLNLLTDADRWILSRVNQLAKDVTENMEKYELGIAVQKVYDFIWDEFCDWYIEMVKPRLGSEEDATRPAAFWTLRKVLLNALKLLHPFMPFLTEQIYLTLYDPAQPAEGEREINGTREMASSIMISSWPVYKEEWNFSEAEESVETIKSAVREIRNVRTGMDVPPSRKAHVYVVSENDKIRAIFEKGRVFFATLARASQVTIQTDKTGIAEDAAAALIHDAAIYIPLEELVDVAKEVERLKGEKAKLEKELARSHGMLSNEKFVSRAPAAKIEEEKAKLEKYEQLMAQVTERLAQLIR